MDKQEKIELLSLQYENVDRILLAHRVPKEDREDLLHEVFITALKSLHQLKNPDRIENWIWRITENTIKKFYWKVWNRNKVEISCSAEDWNDTILTTISLTEPDQISEAVERINQKEMLAAAMKRLEPQEVTVLYLHYGLDRRLIDISEAQRINYSTVKSIHIRALKKLREALEEIEEEWQ